MRSTGIRVPFITGLPPKIPWICTIRSEVFLLCVFIIQVLYHRGTMIFVRGVLYSLTVFILHFFPKTLSVVAEMVSFMAELLLSEEQRKEKQLEQEWLTYNEACVQKEFAKRLGNKPVPIPATLA